MKRPFRCLIRTAPHAQRGSQESTLRALCCWTVFILALGLAILLELLLPYYNWPPLDRMENIYQALGSSTSSSERSRRASATFESKPVTKSIEPSPVATGDGGRPGTYSLVVSGTTFHIDNKYKYLKVIGHGAYGVVISALDTETNDKVAIKKIPKAFDDLVDAKRILREIKLLQHFDHENIINIVDLSPPPSAEEFEDVYIISDLMEADMHRIIYSCQPLTDDHVQYFLYQLLRAIKYMHSANVLHRDLKPSNLLLNSNCDLKVCDFGLGRGVEPDENNTELTEYVVTRWYRAPEIMLSIKEYSKAIDVWSAGCIFAELLGRKPLFPGDDYIHQLQLICEKLGTPSESDMHFITNDKALQFMRKQPIRPGVKFQRLYPDASPDAIDLLERMLIFDPSKRISITEALAHPYLESLHSEDDEPCADSVFSFDFEREDLTKERLQELVLEEVRTFHPEAPRRIRVKHLDTEATETESEPKETQVQSPRITDDEKKAPM